MKLLMQIDQVTKQSVDEMANSNFYGSIFDCARESGWGYYQII